MVTTQEPHWQTEWDTEYIQDEEKEKLKANPFVRTRNGILIDAAVKQIFLTASFFEMCKVQCSLECSNSERKKLFIEGITRFEYEKDYAKRMGLPTDFII